MDTRQGTPGALADMLRELKNGLGLTDADMAVLANVSTRAVQNWLLGRAVPHASTLADLVTRIKEPPNDSPALRKRVLELGRLLDLAPLFGAILSAGDKQRGAIRSRHQITATQDKIELAAGIQRESIRELVDQEVEDQLRRRDSAVPALRPWTTVFTQDPASRLRFEERLLADLQATLHDRLRQPMMSSLVGPTFVTRPWESQSDRQDQMYEPVFSSQIKPLLRARYDAWYELAKAVPIRWLLDKQGHEEYFSAALRSGFLTSRQHQSQLAEMLRIVEEYQGNLQVALQEERIATTYSVFGVASATVYGHVNAPDLEAGFHGIRGVVTEEPAAVYDFRQAFDRDWARWFHPGSPRDVRDWIISIAAKVSDS